MLSTKNNLDDYLEIACAFIIDAEYVHTFLCCLDIIIKIFLLIFFDFSYIIIIIKLYR